MTANEYQNTDLFFALRGGGGGTFGVVVSVTVKAYPDPPVILTMTKYSMPEGNDDKYWKGIEAFHSHIASVNDNGGTGYYLAYPGIASFTFEGFFANQTDPTVAEKVLNPMIADMRDATGVNVTLSVTPVSSMSALYAAQYTGSDTTGQLVQLGSRLLSRSLFDSADGPARVTDALRNLKPVAAGYIEGCVVGGGQVARNQHVKSALNPAWRETLVHLVFARGWTPETSWTEQAAIKRNITDVEVPLLKSLERGMGAYTNEADANERDFQWSFWGENYWRLYEIKRARDPTGLFIARKGVGSEHWDDDGLCRLHQWWE